VKTQLNIDCGDNSCQFAKKKAKGGMRTNGGCRCLSNAGFHRSAIVAVEEMLPELLSLRKKVEQLKEDNDHIHKFIDKCEMWDDYVNGEWEE